MPLPLFGPTLSLFGCTSHIHAANIGTAITYLLAARGFRDSDIEEIYDMLDTTQRSIGTALGRLVIAEIRDDLGS